MNSSFQQNCKRCLGNLLLEGYISEFFYYKYLFSKQGRPMEQSISWESNSLSSNQERKNLIQTVQKLFWKLMILAKITGDGIWIFQ
jgi:hypothetical protein